MKTIFGIAVNCKMVEVANIDTFGNKLIVTITNPLLYKVSGHIKVISLNNHSNGIETVSDIIRYKDNIFDNGIRPLNYDNISNEDLCLKCGHTYKEHIFSSKFCPKNKQ